MRRAVAGLSVLVGLSAPSLALGDPTNDTCAKARLLTFPSETVDSTALVTADSLAPACGTTDPFASWFRFVAPEEGRYELRTTAESGGLTGPSFRA